MPLDHIPLNHQFVDRVSKRLQLYGRAPSEADSVTENRDASRLVKYLGFVRLMQAHNFQSTENLYASSGNFYQLPCRLKFAISGHDVCPRKRHSNQSPRS
jgi:hypothetical protein